jgi:sugar phosphate isomerase/epimerase
MRLAAMPKCYMTALGIEKTMTVFEWIAIAEEYLKPVGVTGLEMHPGFFASFEADYLARVRQAVENAGFTMPMLCASPDFTHPDPVSRAAEIEKQRQMIDAAAALGAVTCRVLSGQRRPEISTEEGIGYAVECITALLPHAEKRGIILNIENHFKDHYWTLPEFAQKAERFLAIVERIESPWFGVNFDPSNTLLANEDPIALLEKVKHRVVTMHASDRRPRSGVTIGPEGITDYSQLIHGEIGTGINDFDRIFAILRGVGFRGWVSIEDGESGIEELVRSARFLAEKINRNPQES